MSLLSPKKYTSLPTSVQAIQLGSHNIEQLANWCGGHRPMGQFHIELQTRTGMTRVHLGDYILQDTDGNFTPLPETVFLKRYVLDTGVFKSVEISLENFEEARYLAIVRIADWLNQQPTSNPLMGTREAAAELYEIAKTVQKSESIYDEEQAVIAAQRAEEEQLALEQAGLGSDATIHVETYVVNHYHYTSEHEDISVRSSVPNVEIAEIPEPNVTDAKWSGPELTEDDIDSIDNSDIEHEAGK